ncbi:hypothetical protein GCM10027519_35470 [Kineococcus endophyticus]
MQPRYGFTVHRKGIAESAGTRFSTVFAVTSWNRTPANSGVVTVRRNPRTDAMPGSAGVDAPVPSSC